MNAIMWISNRTVRVLVKDQEGNVIDTCDEWNNMASTESWLYDAYPRIRIIRAKDSQKKELDQEWSACVDGN